METASQERDHVSSMQLNVFFQSAAWQPLYRKTTEASERCLSPLRSMASDNKRQHNNETK